MKNILITGGAGFIGSCLCQQLFDKGYHITIFDNLSPQVHGKNASLLFKKTQNKSTFIKGDVFDEDIKKKVKIFFKGKLDIIVSDMAANTTGSKSLDAIRTNQLCLEIMNFSKTILKPDGVFTSKLFMGEDFESVKNLAKFTFEYVNFFKPESSRGESKETYLHCKILKPL